MFKKFFIAFTFSLICIGFVNVKADNIDYKGRINFTGTLKSYAGGSTFNSADILRAISALNNSFNGAMCISDDNSEYVIIPMQFPNVVYFGNSSDNPFNVTGSNANKFIYSFPSGSSITNRSYRYYNGELQDWSSNNRTNTTITTYNSVTYKAFGSTNNYYFVLPSTTTIYYDNKILVDYGVNNEHRWENIIVGYDYNLCPTSTLFGAQTFVDGVISWNFKPYVDGVVDYNPTEYDYYFQFAFNIPTADFINTKWALDGLTNSELSSVVFKSFLEAEKANGENIVYNGYGNIYSGDRYTTCYLTLPITSASVNWDSEEGVVSVVYNDWVFDSQLLGGLNPRSNGLYNYLFNLYGSRDKALYALNYVNLNYCNSYCVKKATYEVCNPTCIYYFDQILSNGTVLERRNLLNKTDITPDNITDPTSNDIVQDDTPIVSVPNNTIQEKLNQSINNSYNNITNNYYYDNGLTENILDYYRGFSDGATDENIESALGYVKGTLGSLTHIPLLLSYCFNAFFPIEIIRLFQALLIIFVVFMIIRIIKHLFTH